MAKKRHPHRAAAARPPVERAPAPSLPQAQALPPARRDSWWFDFELDRRSVAVLRFAFFAVLAVDAFLQIQHAPRYGAGDFNVPQLTWLPLPAPSRERMLVLELTLSYLCAMAAFGVATRVVVPIAAALDFYAYFSSQLDSYQHHYLVVLLLVLASFVPWNAPGPRVKSWALRLFTVQIAVLYGWAAIAKMDPLWIDGRTLDAQIAPHWVRSVIAHVPGHYATVACIVLAGELFLATAWCWPRLWRYAIFVGVPFHIGVELAGFQIGQFSYVMMALYTIMLPVAVSAWPVDRIATVTARKLPLPATLGALAGALGLGAVLIASSHLPAAWKVIVLSLPVGAIAGALRRHWTVAAAHLAACLLVFALAQGTDQLLDYYRLWGGSAKRLHHDDEARAAYEQVLAIQPDYANAHAALGDLDLAAHDLDHALAHFQRLEALQPTRARGWVGEAQVRLQQGDTSGAKDAVEHALRVEPGDSQAQALRAQVGE